MKRWRGEPDPRHVKAVDAYFISAAEHGMNASTFTARVVASTGADAAACISSGIGALSGPLHGGAPSRVLHMIEAVERSGDAEGYVKGVLDRGERLMGFGHRVYRAEDPRARVLRRTAKELGAPRFEIAEALEKAALAELHARKPDRVLATNVEFWSAVVLDFAEVPAHMFTSMFTCARMAGWSAHILEQKRLQRLVRPSARYVGPATAQAAGRRGLGGHPARPVGLPTAAPSPRPASPGGGSCVRERGGGCVRGLTDPVASDNPAGCCGCETGGHGDAVSIFARRAARTTRKDLRTVADPTTIRIPDELKPVDGRFGCGPSQGPARRRSTRSPTSRTDFLGTSHRQKTGARPGRPAAPRPRRVLLPARGLRGGPRQRRHHRLLGGRRRSA